jgi:hypothetical protein
MAKLVIGGVLFLALLRVIAGKAAGEAPEPPKDD